MLSGSMIEKFTKKFQNLNKVKQEQVQEEEQAQQSYEKYVEQDKQANKQESKSQGFQDKNQFCLVDSQEKKIQSQQQQCKEILPPIFFQEEKESLLDRIKSKIAKVKQSNYDGNDHNTQLGQIQNSTTLQNRGKLSRLSKSKDTLKQIYQKRHGNTAMDNQCEFQDIEKQESSKRRLVVSQALKQIKGMSKQQRNTFLRVKTKQLKLPSTHELKIWIDAYELIFRVEKEIQKFDEPPSQKQVSKKFAQQFIKYVKSNIHEKRYKLRRICAYALKELKLTTQRVDSWLNRFVAQNIQHLKGIDVSQYKNISSKSLSQERTSQIKNVSKIGKIKQHAKSKQGIQINQNEVKQLRQKKKQEEHLKNERNKLGSKNNVGPLIQSIQSSSQQQNYSEDLKGQIAKIQKVRDKKIQKQAEYRQKNFQKQTFQKQKIAVVILGSSQQKQGSLINNETVSQQKLSRLNGLQIENPTKIKNSRAVQPSKGIQKDTINNFDRNNTRYQKADTELYPEAFKRRIAAKLDSAFAQVVVQILKRKSEEFCVQQDTLKQIYNEHGAYFVQKTKMPRIQTEKVQQLFRTEAATQANLEPNLQLPLSQSIINRQNKNNGFRLSPSQPAKRQQIKPMVFKRQISQQNERIEVQASLNKIQAKVQKSDIMQENKQKISNPLKLLGIKLNSFIESNLGCPQSLVKKQAADMIVRIPEINGKIRQQQLVKWINNFIEINMDKLNWNKPNSQHMKKWSDPVSFRTNQNRSNTLIKRNAQSPNPSSQIRQFSTRPSPAQAQKLQQRQRYVYNRLPIQQTNQPLNFSGQTARNFQISMPKGNWMKSGPVGSAPPIKKM